MNQDYRVSCSCGHDFILAYEIWCKTEVQCPECGQVMAYEPLTENQKEDDE